MADRFNSHVAAVALGRTLHRARTKRGLTLEQVTQATGIHHGQISRIERGQFITNAGNVQKLCTFFHVKPPVSRVGQPDSVATLKRRLDLLLKTAPECGPLLSSLLDALELTTAAR